MEYTIVQVSPGVWELRAVDGTVVERFTGDDDEVLRDLALARLSVELTGLVELAAAVDDAMAVSDTDGLLPEAWTGEIAFSVLLPGGRDFTGCAWSWRDPTNAVVPLMLMTETSEYGHLGAILAGFVEEFTLSGGTVSARGRFYDSDAGRQFRDMLSAGPPYGVSVDPTENIDVDFHEECLETDDDGFCVSFDFRLEFLAYEIGAVTGAPVAGFENAAIALEAPVRAAGGQIVRPARFQVFPTAALTATDTAAPVRAALSIPSRPPAAWLTLAEPVVGHEWLDGLDGADVLVAQFDSDGNEVARACPITIRDDGLVYGHLTWWGQCHVGNPWGPGACASAGPSRNGYADFMTGGTMTAEGTTIPTGVLTVGCEHSTAMDAAGVRDALAHAGMGWAAVSIIDGEHGPWLRGVLHPEVSAAQVELLRRLSLSGEWVGELGGILAVNRTGLPVQRALAASAFGGRTIPTAIRASAMRHGTVARLVGGNIVRACPECEERRRLTAAQRAGGISVEEWHRAMGMLAVLERRTRHLNVDAARAALAATTPAT